MLILGPLYGVPELAEVLRQVATVVVNGTIDDPKVRVEAFQKICDMVGGK